MPKARAVKPLRTARAAKKIASPRGKHATKGSAPQRKRPAKAPVRRQAKPDAVLTAAPDLAGYIEDFRGRYKADALCVVLPATTRQVSLAVRACAEFGTPVLPQGGNTSLCGGAVPSADGARPVIVSLARMRRIRHIDAANGSMEVEAGCVLKTVQDAAAAARRLYAVSLGN